MNDEKQITPLRRSLDIFVQDIYHLTQDKASLLIFFTSNINKAGRIVVHNGNIIDIIYAHKRGNEALLNMLNIIEVKYRTAPLTGDVDTDTTLPSNNIIFRVLGLLSINEDIKQDNILSQEKKQELESILISIIGPMGSIIAEEHIYSAMTMSEVLHGLATELDDESRSEFKDKLS